MANPTKSELSSDITAVINEFAPSSGQCTDQNMSDIVTGIINVFNTLDPDKKPIIKQLSYE